MKEESKPALFDFYTDQQGELKTLSSMLACGDEALDIDVDRAHQYGIPPDIAAKVKPDRPCPELARYLAERYEEFAAELKQSLSFHRKFWDAEGRNSTYYKEKLKSILGHAMPTYTVRLNVQTDGISNWHGTDISINAFEYLRPFKTGMMIQVLIWESVLSQTFIDVRKKWSVSELDEHNVWGLSELTAVAVYQTDVCKSDWPIGYNELRGHQDAVKKLYTERRDFQSYLAAAVEYFQTDPLLKNQSAGPINSVFIERA